MGNLAEWLQQLANGDDPRQVEPHRPAKSASSENTYASDLTEVERMRAELAGMAGELAGWLERHALLARTVTIKVRYADFRTVTRSHTLSQPTAEGGRIAAWASELLERTEAGIKPVRLLGVGVHGLVQEKPAGTMQRE